MWLKKNHKLRIPNFIKKKKKIGIHPSEACVFAEVDQRQIVLLKHFKAQESTRRWCQLPIREEDYG